MEEQAQDTNQPATTTEQKKTPWWGIPRCEELGEPTMLDKGLAKAGKWAQDKLLTGAPKWLKWAANKASPIGYMDGPFQRCPIEPDKDKGK